jgi:two-component system sensor histidine kinase TctE
VRVIDDPFGQVAVLQVEDSGPGIPPGEREQVFRPFYRSLGTGVDGSGLGLAIVREIATRHNAEITLDDVDARRRDLPTAGESGPGALFTVRFPAAPASALHQPAAFRDGHQQAQAQA